MAEWEAPTTAIVTGLEDLGIRLVSSDGLRAGSRFNSRRPGMLIWKGGGEGLAPWQRTTIFALAMS